MVRSPVRETGTAAHSGTYGLHMHVSPGQHWGGEIRYQLTKHNQGNLKEIWARYYVKFNSNWSRSDHRIGKAGFRASSDQSCGAPCLEMTDLEHQTADNPDSALNGQSYYHTHMTDANMANGTFQYVAYKDWNGPGAEMVRNQWYCVETHVILNTPGQYNGTYQNWLDGVLVSDQKNINQRDTYTFDIDNASLISYIGSPWVAEHDMDVYYDDWVVSNQRIGCL